MTLPIHALPIPPVYAWNILAATGIAMQVLYIGGAYGAAARRKYGIKYPDMGNGRYAQKLTDAQWEDFNNHQRAHYNYVEGVASAITLQLLAGAFYPKASAIWGALYMIGRQLYAYGYTRTGSGGRYFGVALLDTALVAQAGMIIYGCIQLLQLQQ